MIKVEEINFTGGENLEIITKTNNKYKHYYFSDDNYKEILKNNIKFTNIEVAIYVGETKTIYLKNGLKSYRDGIKVGILEKYSDKR